MKKKIFFMLINMNVGGTEKALLNMISEIPKEKYDITLFMLEEYGDFLKYIPNYVTVKYLVGYNQIKAIINQPLHKAAVNAFRIGNFINAFILIFLYLTSKVFDDRRIVFNYVLKNYKKIETEYDIAVAYAGPMDFISYFVINKIKAKKKIQWIHFDVTKVGFNKRMVNKIYKKFDKIFIVSEEAKSKLINLVPSISGITEVFYNIVSPSHIKSSTKEGKGFEDDFNGLRILTIGRLSKEKGQDLAVRVLAKLNREGYNVKWYCVGEGNSRKECEKLIFEKNLGEKFILLGSDTNPYPYLEQCDIYVQPSRYEGYCITVIEAKQLLKPIITTNVNGANEQIKNGKTGLIVNIDENEIYLALKKLIDNEFFRTKFSNNLFYETYDSTIEMKKLFNILEG
ncbi:glycosyltransferase [Neobacillus niacini]|uniref:glycosyltransferase n=1 Tax=Neobacillus niacini TaxID=86668 RepID=UPI00286463F8|nr:glycosyltransferase [Neobacillus niacini]MDR7000615.1 glycosyltransferase involved in cell wall biosynthesis [Neobacillus niacini]